MTENIYTLNEIEKFVKTNFPEAKGALLTGSFASKKVKKNSDIDLIIFSEFVSNSFVEKFKIDSQKFDVIYLSTHYNYLIKELFLDINSRYGVYANMLSSSKILLDNDNFLEELIYFSKNSIIKEYGDLNSVEIDFKRKLISNALEDLEDIDSFGEFYYSSSLIIDEITNLILSYKVSTVGRGKNKARELEKVDPEFYNCIMDSIKKNDKEYFVNTIKSKLDFFGGVLESYSSKDIPSIEPKKSRKYEILFKKEYIKSDFISKEFFKIVSFLQKNKINLLYYHFYNDQIIINIETEIYHREFAKYLSAWLITNLKININDKIIFRSAKTKLIPFVSNDLNNALENDLIYLTQMLINNKISLKNSIDTFNFGKQLIERLTIDLNFKDKKEILNRFYSSNLYDAVEIDLSKHNFFQLIENRKKTIEEISRLNMSLNSVNGKMKQFEDFFNDLNFPNKIKEINYENDLNLITNNFFYSKSDEGKKKESKILLLNLYLKYVFDIMNSNQFSLIAFNINENL
ncbi:nucleotidyltransferase domain-containing protein [Flavobacterium sp.]|uniref:nucleotidyltransferase domain-containing protein n=1 Tax=Flavobacterium sp. TaxID=239 RepID=UPI00261883D2|nr:nucleotidyltransferase domain-containing protein [Flavobacterium sp.]MDD2984751.1 nucleotidyltransferase domain-containing protein [Flavobacterium sp.]